MGSVVNRLKLRRTTSIFEIYLWKHSVCEKFEILSKFPSTASSSGVSSSSESSSSSLEVHSCSPLEAAELIPCSDLLFPVVALLLRTWKGKEDVDIFCHILLDQSLTQMVDWSYVAWRQHADIFHYAALKLLCCRAISPLYVIICPHFELPTFPLCTYFKCPIFDLGTCHKCIGIPLPCTLRQHYSQRQPICQQQGLSLITLGHFEFENSCSCDVLM